MKLRLETLEHRRLLTILDIPLIVHETQQTGVFGGGTPLEFAELNGDGFPDAVAVSGDDLQVLLGDGNGAFDSGVIFPSIGQITSATFGDLNADGAMDFVASSSTTVFTFLADASSGETSWTLLDQFDAPTVSVALHDFNGEGGPELLLRHTCATLSVYTLNAEGLFRDSINYPAAAAEPACNGPLEVDLDGDGDIDLLRSTTGRPDALLNNGSGVFDTELPLPGTNAPVAALDMNGDGHADLLAAKGEIHVGLGDGNFSGPVHVLDDDPDTDFSSGDFNGDGNVDFAFFFRVPYVLHFEGEEDLLVALDIGTKIFLGNGDGTFADGVIITEHVARIIDLDQDGVDELFAFDRGQTEVIRQVEAAQFAQTATDYRFKETRSPPFVPSFTSPNQLRYSTARIVDDIDEDGRIDLVFWESGRLGISKGIDGGFGELHIFNLHSQITGSGEHIRGDFLGIGTDQVAVLAPSDDMLWILDATDSPRLVPITVEDFPDRELYFFDDFEDPFPRGTGVATADVNHDGRTDLVKQGVAWLASEHDVWERTEDFTPVEQVDDDDDDDDPVAPQISLGNDGHGSVSISSEMSTTRYSFAMWFLDRFILPSPVVSENDIDDDGDIDIVFSHNQGFMVLWAIGAGDVNRDGKLTSEDIDLLRQPGDLPVEQLDQNGDDILDENDAQHLIEEIAGTRYGDADLDGSVSFADFLLLSAGFGRGSAEQPASWAEGDFSGDGLVGFDDFLVLSGNFGSERD